MKSVLMIFIKNPILGKVKTRLAKSIGDEKALIIYKELLQKTIDIAINTEYHRELWYSSYIDENDQADPKLFNKMLQVGHNLGERMSHSFSMAFENGFGKAVIIGSDCPDLTEERIKTAFKSLEHSDLVIGPSIDGGYYLLGMNRYQPELFSGIEWSESTVFESTIGKAKKIGLRISELPALNDIDTIEDLEKSTMSVFLK